METAQKHLDQKFLMYYYQGKAKGMRKNFAAFLTKVPSGINEIMRMLNHNQMKEAEEKIQQLTPLFISIGLPLLSVQLETVQVYLNFSKLTKSKILMNTFLQEMKDYMPIIKEEFNKLTEETQLKRRNMATATQAA